MKGIKILILCTFVALASARSYGWGRSEQKVLSHTALPAYGPSQYYSTSAAPTSYSPPQPQRKPEPTPHRVHPMEARKPYAVPSYAQAQAQKVQTTPAPAPAYHPHHVEQAYDNAPAARVQATPAPVEETVRISYGTEVTGHHAVVSTPAPVVSSFGPKAQQQVSRQNYYSAPHVSAHHVPAPHVSAHHVPAPNFSAPHVSAPHVPAHHVPTLHVSAHHVPALHVSAPHVPAHHVPAHHVPAHLVPAPQPESNEFRSEVHPHHPVFPKEVHGHPSAHNVQTEIQESTAVHTVHTEHNGQKAVHIIHTQANATGHPVVVHKETHMLPGEAEAHMGAPAPAPIHPTMDVHHPTALPLPVPVPEVRSSPPAPAPFVPTLRFEEEIREGSYHSYEFEAANGIHQKENTTIELLPEDHPLRAHNHGYETDDCDDGHGTALITKTGSYSYISPEGKHIQVSYIADKDGFRPVSDSIPTPPTLPHEAERAAHADAHHHALAAAVGAPEVEENEEAAQAAHLEHEAHAIEAARIAHAEHAAQSAHAEHAAQSAHAEHAAHKAHTEHAAQSAHAKHAAQSTHAEHAARAVYRSVM